MSTVGMAGLALASCSMKTTELPEPKKMDTFAPTNTVKPTQSVTPEITLRQLADYLGITIAAQIVWYKLNDPIYTKTALMVLNKIISDGEFSIGTVFFGFNWEKVLHNWDNVEAQLNSGNVPFENELSFEAADALVTFANQNNLKIHAQHLFGAGAMPPDILDGRFTKEDLLKLVQFVVQTRVLKYKGQIDSWVGYNEFVEWKLYGNHRKEGFWVDTFGERLIENIFVWANQADPDTKLILNGNNVLEPEYDSNIWSYTLQLLKRLKSKNIPVHGIGVQNHFWVFDPPKNESMLRVINAIKEAGAFVMATETTVSQSNNYPFGNERPKRVVSVPDTLAAQTQIYIDSFSAFLETQSEFGMFGFSDAVCIFDKDNLNMPDAQALIFDDKYHPKPAYFAMEEILKNQKTS